MAKEGHIATLLGYEEDVGRQVRAARLIDVGSLRIKVPGYELARVMPNEGLWARLELPLEEVEEVLSGLGVRLPHRMADTTRNYIHAFWSRAIDHDRHGNGEYLTRMVQLYRWFSEEDLGFDGIGRSKGIAHLERMAARGRSEAENSLVLAFLRYYQDYVTMFPERITLFDSSGSEFRSAYPQFWTFSPYALKELEETGLSQRRSFYTVMEWARFSPDYLAGINLPDYHLFYLNKDPDHPSHEIARRSARELVGSGFFSLISDGWTRGAGGRAGIERAVYREELHDLRGELVQLLSNLTVNSGLKSTGGRVGEALADQ